MKAVTKLKFISAENVEKILDLSDVVFSAESAEG